MIKKRKEEIVEYALYVALFIGLWISIGAVIIAPSLSQQLLALSVVVVILGVIANMWLTSRSTELLRKQMKTDRVIEMLKFINSLKSDLEEKIRRIDRSLSGEQFAQSDLLIKPDYKHAHTDILGDENFKWIKEKVDEYNNLVRKKRLEEAKEIGNALKDRLEELKRYHVEGLGIAEEKIEKEGKGKVITAVKKKRKEDE
jgi:hypothetical protein